MKVKRLSVFYADGEYTSHVNNHDMAKKYAWPSDYPIVIQTVEHGGWSMSHYFDKEHPDGICVGTANDMAKFHPDQERVRELLYNAEPEYVPSIRR